MEHTIEQLLEIKMRQLLGDKIIDESLADPNVLLKLPGEPDRIFEDNLVNEENQLGPRIDPNLRQEEDSDKNSNKVANNI